MRVFINLLFLTLVLASAHCVAAPEVNGKMPAPSLDATPITGLVVRRDQSPYYFSIYGGFSGGNFFDNDKTLATSALGFRFSYESNLDQLWDVGAEVDAVDNLIGLNFGRRQLLFSTSDYAPYYKLGAGTHLKGSDALAGFVEIKRWQFRASAGLGNLFEMNNHLYGEAGVGLAVIGWEYFAILGVNF